MKTVVCVSNGAGGGSFECILEVPDGIELGAERTLWNQWYYGEYVPDRSSPKKVKFHNLLDQLISHGCKKVQMEIWDL